MTEIELRDGKYAVIHDNGRDLRALLHGREWRNLDGDGLVLAMAQEIEELRKSKEYCKRIVSGLTHENAILKGEKPITVHLNGGGSE